MGNGNDVCRAVFYVDWKAVIRTMGPHLLVGIVVKSFSGIFCIAYSQEVALWDLVI
jgi:hypothetical protein